MQGTMVFVLSSSVFSSVPVNHAETEVDGGERTILVACKD